MDLEVAFLEENPNTVRWNMLLFDDWGMSVTVRGDIRLETKGEGPCFEFPIPLSSFSFAFDFPEGSSLFLLKIADRARFLAL